MAKIGISKVRWNVGSGDGSEFIIPGGGSVDPDPNPHRNKTDPIHWLDILYPMRELCDKYSIHLYLFQATLERVF